jgi:hypothetical protein
LAEAPVGFGRQAVQAVFEQEAQAFDLVGVGIARHLNGFTPLNDPAAERQRQAEAVPASENSAPADRAGDRQDRSPGKLRRLDRTRSPWANRRYMLRSAAAPPRRLEAATVATPRSASAREINWPSRCSEISTCMVMSRGKAARIMIMRPCQKQAMKGCALARQRSVSGGQTTVH